MKRKLNDYGSIKCHANGAPELPQNLDGHRVFELGGVYRGPLPIFMGIRDSLYVK